jgi:hypothetical protein
MQGGQISATEYFALIEQQEGGQGHAAGSGIAAVSRLRPAHNPKAERSVRLMHADCGGQGTGEVVNRYGMTRENLEKHGNASAQARWRSQSQPAVQQQAPVLALQEEAHDGAALAPHRQFFSAEQIEAAAPSVGASSSIVEASEASASSELVDELVHIYKTYCPEKVGNVPALLHKFAGREEMLLNKVKAKYSVPI